MGYSWGLTPQEAEEYRRANGGEEPPKNFKPDYEIIPPDDTEEGADQEGNGK